MNTVNFYRYGQTEATDYAVSYLTAMGYNFLPCPSGEVTHLLLPVPSFDGDGTVRGSGRLEPLLERLPESAVIVGGNLQHPALDTRETIDLLQDPLYLAQNAAITAHCALKVAMRHSKAILTDKTVLVIGWGRIGKTLSSLLKGLGCSVTVAARKPEDRAILTALGFGTVDTCEITDPEYELIFNTAPSPLVTSCAPSTLAIELASAPGILTDTVINARGLPSKEAPESSGKLIAATLDRIINQRM